MLWQPVARATLPSKNAAREVTLEAPRVALASRVEAPQNGHE